MLGAFSDGVFGDVCLGWCSFCRFARYGWWQGEDGVDRRDGDWGEREMGRWKWGEEVTVSRR